MRVRPLSVWGRWLNSLRPRAGRPGRADRLRIELLEDRVTPATQVFGGLEFTTTGTFVAGGNSVSATAPVEVGVNPAAGSSFTPLLVLNGGVQFSPADPTGTFTTPGSVSGLAGGQSLALLDANPHTFQAPALLDPGYDTLPAADTNTARPGVGGGNLTVTALRLTGQELDLQGSLSVPGLSGLPLAVQGPTTSSSPVPGGGSPVCPIR